MKAEQTSHSSSLPPLLNRFGAWSLILTVVATATKFIAEALGFPAKYCNLVLPRWNLFLDLTCFRPRFRDFHTAAFFTNDYAHATPFVYPAPAALVYEFFYKLPQPILDFVVVTGAFVIAAVVMLWRALRRRGVNSGQASAFVLIALCCSYPLMISYWAENMEIVNGILVGYGLYCLMTERSWTAATLLGIAASIKLFPVIFLVFFLEKKLYKQIVFFLALAAAVDVFALWAISGSVAVSSAGIADGLKYLQDVYVVPYAMHTTGIDHSIFGLFKTILVFSGHVYPSLSRMTLFARIYTCVMGVTDILLYVLVIRRLPFLNRLLCVCILAVLTTPLSIDYTLMHLYVAWGMLVLLAVAAWREQREIPGLKAAFFCLLLLFVPLSEVMFRGLMLDGQIKCLVLIALLVVASRHPFVATEQPSVFAPAA